MLKLGLLVVVGLIVGSIVLKWLAALAVPILLFINRDWVIKIGAKIVDLYKENPIYGILATIAALLMVTPFSIVLFVRTLYNIFVIGKNPIPDKKEILSMVNATKKGIDKMKIDDKKPATKSVTKPERKDGLMSIEEIRAKLNEDTDF